MSIEAANTYFDDNNWAHNINLRTSSDKYNYHINAFTKIHNNNITTFIQHKNNLFKEMKELYLRSKSEMMWEIARTKIEVFKLKKDLADKEDIHPPTL